MSESLSISLTLAIVESIDSEGYTAIFVELPECIGEGKTKQEALDSLREAYSILHEEQRPEAKLFGDNMVTAGLAKSIEYFETKVELPAFS